MDYEVTQWNGMPMHQCCHCAWNTLEGLAVMQSHLDAIHGIKAAQEGAAPEAPATPEPNEGQEEPVR